MKSFYTGVMAPIVLGLSRLARNRFRLTTVKREISQGPCNQVLGNDEHILDGLRVVYGTSGRGGGIKDSSWLLYFDSGPAIHE